MSQNAVQKDNKNANNLNSLGPMNMTQHSIWSCSSDIMTQCDFRLRRMPQFLTFCLRYFRVQKKICPNAKSVVFQPQPRGPWASSAGCGTRDFFTAEQRRRREMILRFRSCAFPRLGGGLASVPPGLHLWSDMLAGASRLSLRPTIRPANLKSSLCWTGAS